MGVEKIIYNINEFNGGTGPAFAWGQFTVTAQWLASANAGANRMVIEFADPNFENEFWSQLWGRKIYRFNFYPTFEPFLAAPSPKEVDIVPELNTMLLVMGEEGDTIRPWHRVIGPNIEHNGFFAMTRNDPTTGFPSQFRFRCSVIADLAGANLVAADILQWSCGGAYEVWFE